MIDRIDALRSEGEAAVAGAAGTAELEDVRVHYLGRKAELPNLLRGVAQLPPDQRGQVGRAANEARRALEAAIDARHAELESSELHDRLARDVVDVTLPALAGPAGRAPARAHQRAARARGRLRRARLPDRRGPRGRHRLLQLRRAQPRRDAPRAAALGHVLRRRGHRPARAHLADADARDGEASAAAVHRHARPRLPARQRPHAHAAVPPARGPGRRRGHHARRPPGHAAAVRARGLRRRARRAPAPALLPLHRAEHRARRGLLQLHQGLPARRLALPGLQGRGLDRAARRRRGRPERLRVRARVRLRPGAPPRLRLGHGHRAHRRAQVRGAGPAAPLRERPADAGAVRLPCCSRSSGSTTTSTPASTSRRSRTG